MLKSSPFVAILFALTAWALLPNANTHAQKVDDDRTSAIEDDYEQEQQKIDDDRLVTTTSSLFEMVLYPTPEDFNAVTTINVQQTIKNTLLLSSSITTGFDSLDSIVIDIQRVELKEDYYDGILISNNNSNNSTSLVKASLIEFEVTMFFDDDDIDINLVGYSNCNNSDNCNDDQTKVESTYLLSNIDIILIIASSFIVIGIICISITNYKKQDDFQQIGYKDSFNGKRRIEDDTPTGSNNNSNNDNSKPDDEDSNHNTTFEEGMVGSLGRMLQVEGNIIEAGSLESSIDSQALMVLSAMEAGSVESSVDGHTQIVVNTTNSPVMSYASSSSSSSTSSSSSSSGSGSTSSSSSKSTCTSSSEENSRMSSIREVSTPCKKEEYSVDSNSVGTDQEGHDRDDETVVSTNTSSSLASKLLRLFGAESSDSTNKANVTHSIASAPTILEQTISRSKSESKAGDGKSTKSARSASSESTVGDKKNDVLNSSTMTETDEQEFRTSWLESKRKALEDIDEGNIEDVFRIDVERDISLEENRTLRNSTTTKSATPSVSEWMKSIRVVGSASETLPSVEHSSIEPKESSQHGKENNSIDLSLEGSLATSLVEV
ncbi:hypothetical protein FRACYDRAFT_237098 [Fragilariopsis cylindrus CCMP1102]|uniref:Uncharacterized protein n=1 Tax=Fragilariopsis cylindrus CCMP1102 TaxID=635003 RepID=A0A1E7FL12_9STRA|nr:hypothetical protein FRACYDRAFT_237098 [Fragilariopsis cylindrus CCMP1102]|eukprot:OEU18817.1 hypothetical protein FRACYDRAFT_237098 [Fragilariopsis cylindrus CCMP1102]